MRFRRRSYSASITGIESIEPRIASSAAYCAMEVGFEVDWLCSLVNACTRSAGASVYPMRQPVIAKVLETEPMMMTLFLESGALAIENGLWGSYVKKERNFASTYQTL